MTTTENTTAAEDTRDFYRVMATLTDSNDLQASLDTAFRILNARRQRDYMRRKAAK